MTARQNKNIWLDIRESWKHTRRSLFIPRRRLSSSERVGRHAWFSWRKNFSLFLFLIWQPMQSREKRSYHSWERPVAVSLFTQFSRWKWWSPSSCSNELHHQLACPFQQAFSGESLELLLANLLHICDSLNYSRPAIYLVSRATRSMFSSSKGLPRSMMWQGRGHP